MILQASQKEKGWFCKHSKTEHTNEKTQADLQHEKSVESSMHAARMQKKNWTKSRTKSYDTRKVWQF